MYRILFVCHGNICRSTMAQSVMAHLVAEAGREGEFRIDSAATSREEIGNQPHRGTVSRLQRAGIAVVPHRARQVRGDEYGDWDYIVGMDSENMRGLSRIFSSNAACRADGGAKLAKLLSFAGSPRDVADPWYTGDFDATYADVVNGCTALLEMLA